MTDDRADRIASENERLQDEEAHKRMLYDRTIGGSLVPRPSEEFIRQNVGELKSEKQIGDEAGRRVDTEMAKEAADEQRRAEVERSIREHNRSVEKERHPTGQSREGGHSSNRDKLREAHGHKVESGRDLLVADKRGSIRDHLRSNRNGRDGITR